MADILYTYKNQVYANITNKCDCNCTFCIRGQMDTVGEAKELWHKGDPGYEEIIAAINLFDFTNYTELVFCGYGEPTCSLENLLKTAKYVKEHYPLQIRLNTNGLANLYHKRNIVPELSKVIDRVSISLNAPDAKRYQEVTRPQFPYIDDDNNPFHEMLHFAMLAKNAFADTQLSIVDVLSKEDIEACQKLADEMGIFLRIRKFNA